MVTIVKGSKTLKVPAGAYDKIYAPAGWMLQGEKILKNDGEKPVDDKTNIQKAKNQKTDKIRNQEETQEVEPEVEIEYVDPEDLLEKPINELDYEELKILAEYLGIDTKGLRSSKSLKEAIKKAKK